MQGPPRRQRQPSMNNLFEVQVIVQFRRDSLALPGVARASLRVSTERFSAVALRGYAVQRVTTKLCATLPLSSAGY